MIPLTGVPQSFADTAIPHQKLKRRLAIIIRNSFTQKNGNLWFVGRKRSYFVKEHSDSNIKYIDDIINLLEFLVDKIFLIFGGDFPIDSRHSNSFPFGTCICSNVETILSWTCHVYGPFEFRTSLGTSILLPMGTNCAPLLADVFVYSYEAEFIHSLLSAGKKHLAFQFNFTYRYIDDVLSINNRNFDNNPCQMYPAALEIKDTTESNTSASYLRIYSCRSGETFSCALPFMTNVTISTTI